MTEPPILAYPDFDLPFIFHTDGSGAGLRCGLFQIQDGSVKVDGYGSRTMTGSEEKYHSSKLEFLASNGPYVIILNIIRFISHILEYTQILTYWNILKLVVR